MYETCVMYVHFWPLSKMLHCAVYVLHKYVKSMALQQISLRRFELACARYVCFNPELDKELFFAVFGLLGHGSSGDGLSNYILANSMVRTARRHAF